MGDQQKFQILTNELIRRLSLIDVENIEMSDVLVVFEVFIQEMKSSGYGRGKIRDVVIGGIKGWRRKIERRKTEGKGFYRHARSTLKSRNYRKLMEKESWFKNSQKDEEVGGKVEDGAWRSMRTTKKGERKEERRYNKGSDHSPIYGDLRPSKGVERGRV